MNLPEKLLPFAAGLLDVSCATRPCVYFLVLNKNRELRSPRRTVQAGVVYIGQSRVNIWGRLGGHVTEGEKPFDRLFVIPIPDDQDVGEIENAFIRLFRPPCNIQGLAEGREKTKFRPIHQAILNQLATALTAEKNGYASGPQEICQ